VLLYDYELDTDCAAMPDLQYTASHNDVMVGLRDHVLPARCESTAFRRTKHRTDHTVDGNLKQYNINTMAGADLTKSVGPSAEFLQMPVAFNYK
jgi:general transcription factor 3C polypeptide 5 (transcription factor C subunit 1)